MDTGQSLKQLKSTDRMTLRVTFDAWCKIDHWSKNTRAHIILALKNRSLKHNILSRLVAKRWIRNGMHTQGCRSLFQATMFCGPLFSVL